MNDELWEEIYAIGDKIRILKMLLDADVDHQWRVRAQIRLLKQRVEELLQQLS